MSKKTHAALYAKLEALYARLPRLACRGLCTIACGGIIATRGEAERMRRAHPERRPLHLAPGTRCGYLTAAGRCRVYAVRPLICRAYGTVGRMSCPHGCTPDRWMGDLEFLELAAEVERLAGEMMINTPDGPAPLGDGFLELAARIKARGAEYTPEQLEAAASATRDLRALHGGRIVGVAPGDGSWIDVDALRRDRERRRE